MIALDVIAIQTRSVEKELVWKGTLLENKTVRRGFFIEKLHKLGITGVLYELVMIYCDSVALWLFGAFLYKKSIFVVG